MCGMPYSGHCLCPLEGNYNYPKMTYIELGSLLVAIDWERDS